METGQDIGHYLFLRAGHGHHRRPGAAYNPELWPHQLQQIVEKTILEATEPLYKEMALWIIAKGSLNLSRASHSQYRRIEVRS
jgi:hypothetical protein